MITRREVCTSWPAPKEDAETVTALFQDMRARGLGDPLLVVSDGAPGVIKAIETCFQRSARQRCLAHRMRKAMRRAASANFPFDESFVEDSVLAGGR